METRRRQFLAQAMTLSLASTIPSVAFAKGSVPPADFMRQLSLFSDVAVAVMTNTTESIAFRSNPSTFLSSRGIGSNVVKLTEFFSEGLLLLSSDEAKKSVDQSDPWALQSVLENSASVSSDEKTHSRKLCSDAQHDLDQRFPKGMNHLGHISPGEVHAFLNAHVSRVKKFVRPHVQVVLVVMLVLAMLEMLPLEGDESGAESRGLDKSQVAY